MRIGPGYARLWSAKTMAGLGGGMYFAALPMLAATLTNEPSLVAGVAVAVELPWLIFALVAGAIADRGDRRTISAVSAGATAVLVGLLAFLVSVGQVTLPTIYVLAFVCGMLATLGGSATATITPMLVPRDKLNRANGRLVAAESAGSEMAGPALGGYLFTLAAALPLAIHTGLAIAAAAFLRSLPKLRPPGPSGPRSMRAFLDEIMAGAKWLVRHPTLRIITIITVIFALTDTAWFALMALYVQQILGLPVSAYGYLVGIGALGGLAGGLLAARIAQRVRSIGRLLAGLLLIAALVQIILATTADPIVTAVMLAASSFAFGVFNVVTVTAFQSLTPTELLGRVGSANRTAIMGASPIGALLGGAAASTLGLRAPLLLGVPVLLVGALLASSRLRDRLPSE